jgi:cbb3-type cytochrome oxidase subunit 3
VIPTAGNWGMTILGLAFLGAMAWMLRARRSLRP